MTLWEGFARAESRICSRNTYPKSYITEYTQHTKKMVQVEGLTHGLAESAVALVEGGGTLRSRLVVDCTVRDTCV